MAHGGEELGPDGKPFTGLAKMFNSYTNRGRANVTIATYSFAAIIGLYLYLKPKKQATATAK